LFYSGDPTVYMALHSSTSPPGGVHPPDSPYRMNSDLTQDPLIAGLEWNIHSDKVFLAGNQLYELKTNRGG